jgi:signal peptidase I
MTVKEPQEDELLAQEAELSAPESATVVLETTRRRRISDAPARARKSDYRLRGLDLEAPALVEVKPRLVRKSHPTRQRRRRRLVMQWLVVLVLLGITAVFLRMSVIRPYAVRSTSMVPTLQPGTNVLVLRPKLLTGTIKTGDLVVFHHPGGFSCSSGTGDTSQDYLKRVIAGPGQTVWSAGKRIYVDGHLLTERGWYNRPFGELGPNPIARTIVPAGSYFVLGDNRTDPCDSRAFGPIADSSFVGKVLATTTRNGHPSVRLF